MIQKSRFLRLYGSVAWAIMLALGSILMFAPAFTPTAQAQSQDLTLKVVGPTYAQSGQTITYQLTIANTTSQTYTGLVFYNTIPANTTYVSGGSLNTGQNRIEFSLASLAPHSSHTVSWVARANNGLAAGTSIDNLSFSITQSNPAATVGLYSPISTLIEAPGTVVASLKNANGRAFDVTVDGFGFDNYTNSPPRNASDDLGADDMFLLFGPKACHYGTTADTCVLSGSGLEWMKTQNDYMNGGHCDGMSVASLRLFEGLPFKGNLTPADFQSGAVNTSDMTFPDQSIENYIAYYWTTQVLPEVYTGKFSAGPAQIVNWLIEDLEFTPPSHYAVHIFKLPGWKAGHSIVAYGVEKVTNDEYRILVYDNNYPGQRQYITVDMVNDTWRYVTASTPGTPPNVYEGTATSGNLLLVPNYLRDLPAGEYFKCPFCSTGSTANVQAAATDQVQGEFSVQYSGEGAILVVNDEGQRTGDDHISQTFVDEIPGAHVLHFNGGLGKEVPPIITVPYDEHDDTFYHVYVHGRTTTSATSGRLTIHGPGFTIGVNDIDLDPHEVFEFSFSPDGDHISFNSTETIEAPEIFISHDPIHDGDPSVVFDVEGVTIHAGETIFLDLDPETERIHFADTGAEDEQFTIDMKLIWPDGDVEDYAEEIHILAGATSAAIDFGAWDGLEHPPIYIDDVLQNPGINHRLDLGNVTVSYSSAPQPNAPAGVYTINATFTNYTEVTVDDVYFTVAELTGGNLLLNADGGPAGTGATVSVPGSLLGEDEILHAGESFTFAFQIGLASHSSFNFFVDANGVPVDWVHNPQAVAADAVSSDSFRFSASEGDLTVTQSNLLYLPVLAR